MKLIRYAILVFRGKGHNEKRTVRLPEATVVTEAPEQVGAAFRIIAHAYTRLVERPAIDSEGYLIIPESPRRDCEIAIERVADLYSLTSQCPRRIYSPPPYAGLLLETPEEKEWAAALKGMRGEPRSIWRMLFPLPMSAQLLENLRDRWAGVRLMAEALSQGHVTGQLHELIRVLEVAFARAGTGLEKPLRQFLLQKPVFGYTEKEVHEWTSLRDRATHADGKKSKSLALEGDVRPYAARIEQAAFDVLLNKRDWHTPTSDRRDVWTPSLVTKSQSEEHIGVVSRKNGKHPYSAILLDPFSVFPHDRLRINNESEGAWANWTDEDSEYQFKVSLAEW